MILRRNAREMLSRREVQMRLFDALLGDRGSFDLQQQVAGTRKAVIELHIDLKAHFCGVPFA